MTFGHQERPSRCLASIETTYDASKAASAFSTQEVCNVLWVALVHAGLGQRDSAFAWLNKAFDEWSHWLVWLRLDPRWKGLRSDRTICGAGEPRGIPRLNQAYGSRRQIARAYEYSRTSAVGVRRDKAALSSGCEPHPATAPAGSNRSSHGGNEVAEAFD